MTHVMVVYIYILPCLKWTVRGEALAAVINNHAELMELWDWSLTRK